MSTSRTPRRLTALSVLALAGFAASAYLTQHFYEVRTGAAGFKSLCNIGQAMNCDAVAASRYAELFAGLPLSSFSAGWFVALLIVSLLARSPLWRREALRGALALTAIGTLLSAIYFVIMSQVLQTWCLFCLIIDGINLAALGVVLSLGVEGFKKHALDRAKAKTLAKVTAGSVAVVVLLSMVLLSTPVDRGMVQTMASSVLTSPVVSVGSGTEIPSMGAPNAPVTIVEFADFQCPACKQGAQLVHTILNRYPGKVRVVPRHFPLDPSCNRFIERQLHGQACEAARAAYCAHQQGKFEAVYENLFENQAKLGSGRILEFAQEAGADPEQLKTCMTSPETAAAISRDIEEANNLGVKSTPTIFINGRKMEGVYPVPVWIQVIDQLLAGK